MSEQDERSREELATRFTYHPPRGSQAERYEMLRAHGHTLATLITSLCPESRERSLAITKIEEAVMWANAAIARREEIVPLVPESRERSLAITKIEEAVMWANAAIAQREEIVPLVPE